MNEVNEHRRTIRRCRYPGCGSEGHNRSTCAMRYRQGEEVACGRMIPRVHADNKEELRRIRAMTADRKIEERMLNQARELQEGALRAQERAQARQDRDRQREAMQERAQARQDRDRQREAIRAEAEARYPQSATQNAYRRNSDFDRAY